MMVPPYFCDKNINFVMHQLKQRSNFASEWFKDDNMKIPVIVVSLYHETDMNICGLK